MTDPIAERIRKLGGIALRSIGDISGHQRLQDNDAPSLTAEAMLKALLSDNQELTNACARLTKFAISTATVATASLIENWIDETEQRSWFLYESVDG